MSENEVRTIAVKDIGAVAELKITLPAEGGITVLRGKQGVGKSTALNAARKLIGGVAGKLPVRDGRKRGVIDGCGAVISVSTRTTTTGEVDVVSLEGKFDIAELVEPGIASPDRADAARIKALLRMKGVKADPAMFVKLLGSREQLDRHCKPETLAENDLVEMAAKIKRDLDTAARSAESQSQNATNQAVALRSEAEGIDLKAPDDEQALAKALEEASAAKLKLASEAGHRLALIEKAKKASEQLDLQLSQGQTTPEEAKKSAQAKQAEGQQAVDLVRELERGLADAKALVAVADEKLKHANETLAARGEEYKAALQAIKDAEAHERTLAAWRAQVADAQNVKPVADAEMMAAINAQVSAHEAVEIGVLVRKAKLSQAKADQVEAIAKEHSQIAARLRDAGKMTDDILSEAVADNVLRVDGGRLVLNTDRGDEYLAELSAGERCKIAVDLAADAVGEHGLIVLPQEFFEGLDPDNRDAIHQRAIQRKVHILTAEVSRGELRAEGFWNQSPTDGLTELEQEAL